MPRKGKDQTFDKLVVQLGLQENRKYASTYWRNFKLDKGFVRPPSISVDPTKLLKGYRLQLERYTVQVPASDGTRKGPRPFPLVCPFSTHKDKDN
jgi:hypothetical protein